MKFEELKQDHEYLATATDGNKYKGIFSNGFFFCVWPTYTPGGTKNELIDFEELTKEGAKNVR